MKKLSLLLGGLLVGCATNVHKQTDESYEINSEGKAQAVRKVTTSSKTRTFFDSDSKLTDLKATQTDKSQSISIGSLDSNASGTNVVQGLQSLENILKMIQP